MTEPRRCPKCWTEDPDLTHVVLEYVGALLAEPLRRAFDVHLDEHGCGIGDHRDPRYVGGFLNCPEAARLWDLLPLGDAVIQG